MATVKNAPAPVGFVPSRDLSANYRKLYRGAVQIEDLRGKGRAVMSATVAMWLEEHGHDTENEAGAIIPAGEARAKRRNAVMMAELRAIAGEDADKEALNYLRAESSRFWSRLEREEANGRDIGPLLAEWAKGTVTGICRPDGDIIAAREAEKAEKAERANRAGKAETEAARKEAAEAKAEAAKAKATASDIKMSTLLALPSKDQLRICTTLAKSLSPDDLATLAGTVQTLLAKLGKRAKVKAPKQAPVTTAPETVSVAA